MSEREQLLSEARAIPQKYSDPLVRKLIDVGNELRRLAMHKEADTVQLAAGFIEHFLKEIQIQTRESP